MSAPYLQRGDRVLHGVREFHFFKEHARMESRERWTGGHVISTKNGLVLVHLDTGGYFSVKSACLRKMKHRQEGTCR